MFFFCLFSRPPTIGPALPPGFKRQDEDEEGAEGFSGPALPPGYTPDLSSSEEEDDYVIGPMPSKGPSQDSVALDIERRAQRMKDKLTGVDVSAFYVWVVFLFCFFIQCYIYNILFYNILNKLLVLYFVVILFVLILSVFFYMILSVFIHFFF